MSVGEVEIADVKDNDEELGLRINFGIAGNVTRRLESLNGLGRFWKVVTEGFFGSDLKAGSSSILFDNFSGKCGGNFAGEGWGEAGLRGCGVGLDVAEEGGGERGLRGADVGLTFTGAGGRKAVLMGVKVGLDAAR